MEAELERDFGNALNIIGGVAEPCHEPAKELLVEGAESMNKLQLRVFVHISM